MVLCVPLIHSQCQHKLGLDRVCVLLQSDIEDHSAKKSNHQKEVGDASCLYQGWCQDQKKQVSLGHNGRCHLDTVVNDKYEQCKRYKLLVQC